MYLSAVKSALLGGWFDSLYNALASHTTCIVCVNCIREWRDLQFNINSDYRFFSFKKLFHVKFYLLSKFLPEICISFWCLTWVTNQGFTSNKPTQLKNTRLRRLLCRFIKFHCFKPHDHLLRFGFVKWANLNDPIRFARKKLIFLLVRIWSSVNPHVILLKPK